jgi:hypothetical protein
MEGKLGLMNLEGQKILCFILRVLLMLVVFTMDLTTKRLEIEFFIVGILLLMASLY